MTALSWWWVRHAPTGAAGAVGWSDVACDLSDAAGLGALAAALPQAPVICSDLSRARLTADRIAGDRPRLGADRALRELHFGAWEGLGFDVVAERWPEEHRAFWETPGPARATEGEGFDDLSARVDGAIDRLNADLRAGHVIAVAHMGPIMAALRRALGLSARQALAFRIDPLSVTRLDWLPEQRQWRVASVNGRL